MSALACMNDYQPDDLYTFTVPKVCADLAEGILQSGGDFQHPTSRRVHRAEEFPFEVPLPSELPLVPEVSIDFGPTTVSKLDGDFPSLPAINYEERDTTTEEKKIPINIRSVKLEKTRTRNITTKDVRMTEQEDVSRPPSRNPIKESPKQTKTQESSATSSAAVSAKRKQVVSHGRRRQQGTASSVSDSTKESSKQAKTQESSPASSAPVSTKRKPGISQGRSQQGTSSGVNDSVLNPHCFSPKDSNRRYRQNGVCPLSRVYL